MEQANQPNRPRRIQLMLSVGLTVLGGLLLVSGFIAPPMGTIEPSILVAYGEVMTFAGALIGIDYHYRH